VVALEPEFYLMDQERDGAGMGLPATSPRTGRRREVVQVYSLTDIDDQAGFLNDIQTACRAQGVPAGSALSEYAAGQYEVNLKHTSDALAAADHAFLLKRIIKGVARNHGYEATFMAKPFGDRAGSGLHIHLSLLDGSGRNVFAGAGRMPVPRLRHAIGGLRVTMPEAMALFAPNTNSYRRFRSGSYAPLAPTWGIDNRTVALRVPLGPPEGRRVEHRVAGADANPYLALAAVLAGVHYGLVNEIDPGPPIEGNGYEQAEASLPGRWSEALTALERAQVLPTYFDPRTLWLYLTVKRAEMERFDAQVTPLEHQWYLSEL
jgi:glutamine synthetase